MNVMSVALAVILAAGCDKKETSAPAPATAAAPTTPAAPAAAAPGKTAQLTCAKVAPSAATWFPGTKLEEKDSCPSMPGKCGPSCMWLAESGESINLGLLCNMPDRAEDKKLAYKTSFERQKDAKDLPGVGAMAFQFSPMQGMTMVQAWDDDSRCMVTVGAAGEYGGKAVDLAKEAIASVKAGDVD
jgi:hypothetical protein